MQMNKPFLNLRQVKSNDLFSTINFVDLCEYFVAEKQSKKPPKKDKKDKISNAQAVAEVPSVVRCRDVSQNLTNTSL